MVIIGVGLLHEPEHVAEQEVVLEVVFAEQLRHLDDRRGTTGLPLQDRHVE